MSQSSNNKENIDPNYNYCQYSCQPEHLRFNPKSLNERRRTAFSKYEKRSKHSQRTCLNSKQKKLSKTNRRAKLNLLKNRNP
jgi:hypothetical protein